MRQRLKSVAGNPFVCLLLLNALFVAPAVGKDLLTRPYAALQPCGDLLLLAFVAGLGARLKHGRWIRKAAIVCGVLLWIYMLDELVATLIVRKTPPLYDQVYLVRHLGVLVFDLWNWKMALGLLGIAIGLVAIVALGRRLVRCITAELQQRPLRGTLPVVAALIVLLGVGTTIDQVRGHERDEALVRWTSPAVVDNVEASLRMHRALQKGIDHSPYAAYEERVALTRKPDVHLFLVESYGRILVTDPEAGPAWREQAQDIQRRLDAAGWHSVTAFSEAPISGGRSWLAEATLLTGVVVRYEAMFQHLMMQIDRAPNLVSFLATQGYETVLLAPKDRPRPGVESVNRYNYDRQLLALDLEYTGPSYGWGVIPDQYSLGYAHEQGFGGGDGPLFTNFHMVSSHAPWKVVPPLVEDWRMLAEAELPEGAEVREASKPGTEFLMRARRYAAKRNHRYKYMGYVDAVKIDAYADAVRYDLEVLTSYLEGIRGDKIVVIMGDHQPPLISGEDNSHDVPIHVLSRDPRLLDEFRDAGFIDGLLIDAEAATSVAHEGMFSLFVRALARCCSEVTDLPEYVPEGVKPGVGKGRRG